MLIAGRDIASLARQEGAAAAPPDRHRLPGLQASAEPERLRQRRLRPAGDRRLALGDPPQGARRAPPRRPRRQGKNFPDQLSGGEQQRLSVARAFVNHPPLLLADEPTGNLDPNTSIGIMQVLYRINRTGTTVVVVTHDREMVDKMRRRVIALERAASSATRPPAPTPPTTSRPASSPCGCARRWASRARGPATRRRRWGESSSSSARGLGRSAAVRPEPRGDRHGLHHRAAARCPDPGPADDQRQDERGPQPGRPARLPNDEYNAASRRRRSRSTP